MYNSNDTEDLSANTSTNIPDIGVYYKDFFAFGKNYFDLIEQSHEVQNLTESNKDGFAFRKGIYLSKVEQENDLLKFNLLRCSTNFSGPTENFREVDNEILSMVNEVRKKHYCDSSELNHVLIQIYNNYIIENKHKKAKIKEHSDKTKDMPENGLLAFCTFYKNIENFPDPNALTTMRFRLKECVTETSLQKNFDVILHPNSLLMIPLHVNRLYTHEIIPSSLPVDKIPVRMGYVIRSSNVKAVHKDNKTYIDENGVYKQLQEITDDDIKTLRAYYYAENTTADVINYPDFYFSMNRGDYMKPIL